MNSIIVRGGRKLAGRVTASGAKNSALKAMAASILTDEPVVLTNVPDISDVRVMMKTLNHLGVDAIMGGRGTLRLHAAGPIEPEAPYEFVRRMRASVIVLGPLLARLGRARVAMPGGCQIGSRKIDIHIRGLERLGARITVGHGFIEGVADRLVGAHVPLDFPSVGATENILMAAVLAEGTTIIENAAREPEIVDLADCLVSMGARIVGAGTSTVQVTGVERLGGTAFRLVGDRIEAATYLVAGALTGGDVEVDGVSRDHLGIVLKKLAQTGATVESTKSGIRVAGNGSPQALRISTLPYPGFPTDLQAVFLSLLSFSRGTSVVTENVFENRFSFVQELRSLGSDVRLEGHHAVVRGRTGLVGTSVTAPDLRAGAALIVAGLGAEGTTRVGDVHHVHRGYERLVNKLTMLGAEIESAEPAAEESVSRLVGN